MVLSVSDLLTGMRLSTELKTSCFGYCFEEAKSLSRRVVSPSIHAQHLTTGSPSLALLLIH